MAVDDLSFDVKPGIVTGFIGPDGAGKATTMRLILRLDGPTRDEVTALLQAEPAIGILGVLIITSEYLS